MSNGITLRYSTGGVFDSVEELSKAIQALGEKHHILVPGGAIGGELPLLHAGAIGFVFIDPERETYPITGGQGKVGIDAVGIDKICAAAGVRPDPNLCGRVDDGSNPYRVGYQYYGTVLQLDGTERALLATKWIDLTADRNTPVESWGADAQEIARIAAKADPPRDPWPQILQARQHINSLAETKAKNRAARRLGIRSSYTKVELLKAFAVVRLSFTGRAPEHPELEREVGRMIAERALGASRMLYGGERRQLAAPQAPRVVPRIVHDEPEPDEGDENGNGKQAAAPEPKPAAKPAEPEAAPGSEEHEGPPAGDEPQGAPKPPAEDPLIICGRKGDDGKCPKKPCSEFTISELKSKIAYYERTMPDWEERWAANNQKQLDALKAWLSFREFDPRQGKLNLASDEVSY